MDEDRGGWWTALTILLVFTFLILTSWVVARLHKASDWDPSRLPFVIFLAYGLLVMGFVVIATVFLTRIFVSGLQLLIDELRDSRGRGMRR
jgi:hypothetical protein